MTPEITLQEAMNSLYGIAVTQAKATSTIRLQKLGAYCVTELARRGLADAELERAIPGGGRSKQWDVAWMHQGKYRLVISLKSILSNLSGTVPNRIDDLIGEAANAQMASPEIVVGYVMIFDVASDFPRRDGITWCDFLSQRLSELSGRSAPHWSVGTIEASVVVRVNFASGPVVISPETEMALMLDRLVAEVRKRNPSLP